MNQTFVHDKWMMEILGDNVYGITGSIEAVIPGSVYGNLLTKGLMPDPFYRDNELTALKLMDNDFSFSTSFILSEEQFSSDKVFLRFEGIDTLADVYVNGQLLGSAYNMYRTWEYDLKSLGRVGENELKVIIHSPVKYIREENEKCYTGGALEAMQGFPHLRKCHCMFGWDWGPRLPDAGIFRPVSVVCANTASIDSVLVTQTHDVWETADIYTKDYQGCDVVQSYNVSADVTLDFDVSVELTDVDNQVRDRP